MEKSPLLPLRRLSSFCLRNPLSRILYKAGRKAGSRLRESRLMTPSGRGGDFTQPRAHSFTQLCKCNIVSQEFGPRGGGLMSSLRSLTFTTVPQSLGPSCYWCLPFPPYITRRDDFIGVQEIRKGRSKSENARSRSVGRPPGGQEERPHLAPSYRTRGSLLSVPHVTDKLLFVTRAQGARYDIRV